MKAVAMKVYMRNEKFYAIKALTDAEKATIAAMDIFNAVLQKHRASPRNFKESFQNFKELQTAVKHAKRTKVLKEMKNITARLEILELSLTTMSKTFSYRYKRFFGTARETDFSD